MLDNLNVSRYALSYSSYSFDGFILGIQPSITPGQTIATSL